MALPRTRSEAIAYLPGKSFDELSLQWQADLAAMRPEKGKPFTQEQREYAKDFWLEVASTQLPRLAILNEGRTITLNPITTAEGQYLIPIEILTDIRKGENFYHAVSFLRSLPIRYWVKPPEVMDDSLDG
jgi:hypothetical protein